MENKPMNKQDIPAFFNFLSVMAEYYQPLSRVVRNIYWEGLRRFSLEDIKAAFSQHVCSPQHGKFMPKIADFVGYIEGSEEDKAMMAWSKVLKSIEEIGTYQSVIFDDPVITKVIKHMGGWIKLCRVGAQELPFIAKEFERLHRYYATRLSPFSCSEADQDSSEQTYLCGIFEHENSLRGYISPPPVVAPLPQTKSTQPTEQKIIEKTEQNERSEGIKALQNTEKTKSTTEVDNER